MGSLVVVNTTICVHSIDLVDWLLALEVLVLCPCWFISYLEFVPWICPLVIVSITVAAPSGSLQLEH